ncbi:MAG: hypothetical protein ACYTG0_12190 [Planctomycetota bacterium]|jgi:hypothetical protein
MVDRTREQLLGYLLGALDDTERESVESELERNPELARELARVQERLHPLWAAQPDFAPPPRLAERTCELVASHTDPAPQAEYAGPAPVGGAWGGSSWWDITVAAGMVLVVALLIFPAIQRSRYDARLLGCQDNLRTLGAALHQYSQSHVDLFPPVYDEGRLAGAGIYAPVLLSHGLVDRSERFVCPGSPLAENGRFRVPFLAELASAPRKELIRQRRTMGGSFAYSLGYREPDGRYTTRDLRRPNFAMLADVPRSCQLGYQSLNHGGCRQNVAFEDGSVRFCLSPRSCEAIGNIFVNDRGDVAAGQNPFDSVVGPSTAVPNVTFCRLRGSEWP